MMPVTVRSASPRSFSMTRPLRHRVVGPTALALVAFVSIGTAPAIANQPQVGASAAQPSNVQTADGLTVVIRSQYRRLAFTQEIQRIAVGDTEIMSAEVISSRELLLLGRETGRTTLIVWFTNGSSREYRLSVQQDLSVLERALKLVNPSIEVESAPDRDALVLTGVVPDFLVSQTAEAVARNYLDAGNNRRGTAQPLLAAPPTPDAGAPAPAGPGAAPQNAPPTPQAPAAGSGSSSAPPSVLQGTLAPSGTVINLI